MTTIEVKVVGFLPVGIQTDWDEKRERGVKRHSWYDQINRYQT